ncbi:MAG: TonB-dependent receptor [Candidatus Acidiferrales bacterium]
MQLRQAAFLALLILLAVARIDAQSPNGTISGLVIDPSGAIIAGADILVANDATGVQYSARTNQDGIYLVANLLPGTYRLQVAKIGFKTLIKPEIILNVQDALAINFTLPVGAASEIVTVEAGVPLLNTESAAVSTVVDRQFAENLPMNGRSFQTLIQLTPGIVLTPTHEGSEGQFSVNGQRTASNNWMVDGVSANIGVGSNFNGGNGVAGAVGSFSVLGGTNSLVSVDAMQEFRIETSTYAPEFGRTPGAQISIATRSGANQFHGTAFDYLRNYDLDANNWFADEAGLAKPAERQNDFGGTFSGRILRDRTFFFFSYEGLRLGLPQTTFTGVPDLSARQNAAQPTQPLLNAYPLPNGPDNVATGVADFNASYSNPATLDAYSLRLDHKIGGKVALFGRYNYSPSQSDSRGAGVLYPLSDVNVAKITTQTATTGITWSITPFAVNDFRFNYSTVQASSSNYLDGFGGAVPPSVLPFPNPYSIRNATFEFTVFGFAHPDLSVGSGTRNGQRQLNFVDSFSAEKGTHQLKFGVDYRRLSPSFHPSLYTQEPIFLNVLTASANDLFAAQVFSVRDSTLLFQNLGLFAQDTWRVLPRLTLTYGLRWDMDFSPSSLDGPALPAVSGFNLSDLSGLALAPPGTPPFQTTFGNVAPRIGLAYQLRPSTDWGLVLRGGFGVFYDLATSQVGDLLGTDYPFGATATLLGGALGGTATFPLTLADSAPPPITAAELSSSGATLTALDPRLKLPYTLEWNIALQQQLGTQQSFSASYIGSTGRRLLQSAFISSPNPSFSNTDLIANTASSDYAALQLQFQRRLSHGLQALASYTWSHSIDDGSNGTFGAGPNSFVPGVSANANRGPSDFDLRNTFSAALTYDIPAPRAHLFAKTILGGWSVQNVLQAWSAPPVNVYYSSFEFLANAFAQIRPDIVPDMPLYLHGPQYPGGKALNPAAFTSPPTDSSGNPLRQGDLGRNALRGFGAAQWDFAVHRDFPIHEGIKLQFRAEMFNVLNHPNFGPPIGDLQSPTSINSQFGVSTETLAQSLGGTAGVGGFSSLYQVGGPRSIQLALKLFF